MIEVGKGAQIEVEEFWLNEEQALFLCTHSYTRVYVEEIGTFPNEGPVLKLMATLRSGAGVPVGFDRQPWRTWTLG
jgi:hypothetical protein